MGYSSSLISLFFADPQRPGKERSIPNPSSGSTLIHKPTGSVRTFDSKTIITMQLDATGWTLPPAMTGRSNRWHRISIHNSFAMLAPPKSQDAPEHARCTRTRLFGRMGNPKRELRGRTSPTVLTLGCKTVKPSLCHRHASAAPPAMVGNVRPQHESATLRKNMLASRNGDAFGWRYIMCLRELSNR